MNDESIIKLIDKFGSSNVAELDIAEGSLHIVLRKESAVGRGYSGAISHAEIDNLLSTPYTADEFGTAPGSAAPSADESAVRLGITGTASAAGSGEAITSPIVATFYASSGPDAPVFVHQGSRVKAGDTLCILEAMKMMNHLEAEFDCEILAVKAASGDLVEYGQVLFEVKRL
ncbi:acetyl-CoA carboxylase, biotin carboxyl carrier protein [Spirochaetia bacterium]|nr:acetyl-CoA carboxylase, biotin carboxyl carrier protein [Spirochaetia bacterium]